jgi:hypothetical protein
VIQILDGDWFAGLKSATWSGAHVGGQSGAAHHTVSPPQARNDEQVGIAAPILQDLHVINLNSAGNLQHRLIKKVPQFAISGNLTNLNKDTNMASDFLQRDALGVSLRALCLGRGI